MSAIVAGLIGGGLAAVGGILGGQAEREGIREATEFQRESRDIGLRLAEPQLVAGNQALAQLGSIFGIEVPQLGGSSGAGGVSGVLRPQFDPNTLTGQQRDVLNEFLRRFQVSPFDRPELVFNLPDGQTRFPKKAGEARDDFVDTFGFDPFTTSFNEFQGLDETGQPAGPGGGVGGGVGGGTAQPAPLDLEGLVENNPLIQFQREQGDKAITAAAAARGLNLSGGTLEEFARFNQGLSSTGIQNFVLNPLFQLAGFGNQASQQFSNVAQNTGGNLSNLAVAGGASRGSAIQNAGNIAGNIGLLAASGGFPGTAGTPPGGTAPGALPGTFNPAGGFIDPNTIRVFQ